MPPKRPRPDSASANTSRKEQRIAQRRDARRIDTQPGGSSATGAGSGSGSASTSAAHLPPQLDVEATISSRKYEILSLLKAIKTARNAGSTRAWQLLPRHARRRAASHNILRLPTRLRKKGLAELRASTTTPKTRAEVRKRSANHPKSKSIARKQELAARAARPDARWLESHMWFAKRFRMSRPEFDGPRWGFVMPEEPSMKGKRTDWRAIHGGCAVFDASWDQWMRVSVKVPCAKAAAAAAAAEHDMQVDGDGSGESPPSAPAILHSILADAGIALPAAVSATDALRPGAVHQTTMHSGNPGPSNRALCPVVVYVVPPGQSRPAAVASTSDATAAVGTASTSTTTPSRSHSSSSSRHVRKTLALLPPPPPLSSLHPSLEVLVRVHPAAASDVERSLQRAISRRPVAKGTHCVFARLQGADASVLVGNERKVREKKEDKLPTQASHYHLSTQAQKTLQSRLAALQRQRLRSQAFNVFELYGPLTGSVLGGVLRPVAGTDDATMRAWDEATTTTTELATGWDTARVFDMRVHDPRLGHPYRMRKVNRKAASSASSSTSNVLPPASPTSPHLLRDGYTPPAFTKGDLDRRRAKLLVPGRRLEPDSRDDVVPIVLVQRARCNSDAASATAQPCLAGYTLLVPQAWSRAFLHSLLSTAVRPLSLAGLRVLSLEAGVPAYPHDWIGSPGWHDTAEWQFEQRRSEWLRRPPAKRVNFDACDVQWPFGGGVAMWSQCAGNARRLLDQVVGGGGGGGDDIGKGKAASSSAPPSPPHVHVAGSKAVMTQQCQAVEQLLAAPEGITVNAAARARSLAHLAPTRSIVSQPFVIVRLEAIGKGALEETSELRVFNTREVLQQQCAKNVDADADADTAAATLPSPSPSPSLSSTTHVGSITSGHFSLTRGKGCGVGAMAQSAWVLAAGMYASVRKEEDGQRDGSGRYARAILVTRHTRGGPLRLVRAEVMYL